MNGYERISKYKSHMLAFAILVVVFGHTQYYHSGLMDYADLNVAQWYTLGSVEIFMFISGFGIFQSLHKNRDTYTFYIRRLGKIFPSYLPVILCWIAFKAYIGEMRFGEAVGNITTFGWWGVLPNQFNWYLPATMILYLLSPLFYDVITRAKRPWLGVVALFVLIVSLWRSNILMSITRFPTYYLGMYYGSKFAAKETPTKRSIVLWAIAGVIAMALVPYYFIYRRNTLWYYGMFWILFFFSTHSCLFGVTWLLEKQSRWKWGRALNRGLQFLGERSFEIYLVHLAFFEVCLRTHYKSWKAWILFAIVGIVMGCVYNAIITRIQRHIKQKRLSAAK